MGVDGRGEWMLGPHYLSWLLGFGDHIACSGGSNTHCISRGWLFRPLAGGEEMEASLFLLGDQR